MSPYQVVLSRPWMPDIRLEALRLLDQMAVEVREDAWWEPEDLHPAGAGGSSSSSSGPTSAAPERRSSSLGQLMPPGPAQPGGTPAPLQTLQRVPAGSGRASVSGDFAGWTGVVANSTPPPAAQKSHLGTVRASCARCGNSVVYV